MVYDIDLMWYFMGEVVLVQVQMVLLWWGFENEDVVVVVLMFESGVICMIFVFDSVVFFWSWELILCEYLIYLVIDEFCYLIGGFEGVLLVFDMWFWIYEGGISWWNFINVILLDIYNFDLFVNQIVYFGDVVCGIVEFLVSGEEGLKILEIIEVI